MSTAKKVTPRIKGVRYVEGQRYMLNINTGAITPWNDTLARYNGDLQECWAKPDDDGFIASVSLYPPVEIVMPDEEKDVVVPNVEVNNATPASPELKPWQIAQAAKKAKAAEAVKG